MTVSSSTTTVDELSGTTLASLPRADRVSFLEDLVVTTVKRVLLMGDDEELPFDGTFFELGLTSLGLSDVKQAIEAEVGRGINSTVLFNRPTVQELLDYLTGELLPELFATPGTGRPS